MLIRNYNVWVASALLCVKWLQTRKFFLAGLLAMGTVLLLNQAPLFAHADGLAAVASPSAYQGLQLNDEHCGIGGYRIVGTELCTHGPDAVPEEFDLTEAVQPATAELALPAHQIRCDGDGVSGKRVQVIYAHAEDVANRYDQYVASIRLWAAQTDAIYQTSALKTDGYRQLRFVTDLNCEVNVLSLRLPADADDNFQATISALIKAGYYDTNRKYLIFMDAQVYCGIASVQADSTPTAENLNERVPGYARVDNGCWNGRSAAHELTHTLGGIQKDAPNSSGGWHCTDLRDLMCYSDWPNYPSLTTQCSDPGYDTLLDCNHDDYFHTNPPPASYLDTHWNVANSAYLFTEPLTSTTPVALPTAHLTVSLPTTDLMVGSPVVFSLAISSTEQAVLMVEVFAGETLLRTITQPPYAFSTDSLAVGDHLIQARLTTDQGVIVHANELSLTVLARAVSNQSPPLLTLGENKLYLPTVLRGGDQ